MQARTSARCSLALLRANERPWLPVRDAFFSLMHSSHMLEGNGSIASRRGGPKPSTNFGTILPRATRDPHRFGLGFLPERSPAVGGPLLAVPFTGLHTASLAAAPPTAFCRMGSVTGRLTSTAPQHQLQQPLCAAGRRGLLSH